MIRGEAWIEQAFLKRLAITKETLARLQTGSAQVDSEMRSHLSLLEKEPPWFESFAKEAIEIRKQPQWNTAQYLIKTETVSLSDQITAILNKLRNQRLDLMHEEATQVSDLSQKVVYIALRHMVIMTITALLMPYSRAKQITQPLVTLTLTQAS